MKVSVVLKHTCVNNFRNSYSVELIKVGAAIECLGNFNSAVASEVEEYNGVAVVDCSYRLAVFGDNERGKILVDGVCFGSVCFNSLVSGRKVSAFAEDVSLPTELYHMPVSFVTVHCDNHSAAAGRDFDIAVFVGKLCDELFKRIDIVKSRSLTNVTTVKENVNSDCLYSGFLSFNEHSLEVVDV